MNNSIVQYFIKFGHLVLPGIGTLNWQKQEAFWENNKLNAPKEQIILEPIFENPTSSFFTFIAEDLGISAEQAQLQFQEYMDDFTCKTIASLNIGNLGTLHKNASQYSWNNLYNSSHYYKDMVPDLAENSSEDTASGKPKKGESWIIWAVIMTIIAVSLILFKFL
jgi:hypothetical protein